MRRVILKINEKGSKQASQTEQSVGDQDKDQLPLNKVETKALDFKETKFTHNFVKTTKYTLISFLPISLFLQCKNVIHIFFIFNGFLQTIPAISTNSPLASIVPVVWVMIMGMLFEMVADIRRWRSDTKVNNYIVQKVFADGASLKSVDEQACNLVVGDIIQLKNDGQIPADCIVLQTDDSLGQCYISTSNLDGEKNLKPKLAPEITQGKLEQLIKQGDNGKVSLEYTNPTKDIYHFFGILKDTGSNSEIDLKQFIPRGCVLKNSTKTYAMVVYTGTDTKLAQNQGKYVNKISNISQQTNIFLAGNILVMLLCALPMAFIGNIQWNKKNGSDHYYIFDEAEKVNGEINYGKYAVNSFMSFYLLYCNLLPLDMAITLMLAKLMLVALVNDDWHMLDFERSCIEGTPIGCQVKNLTMLEDFAQINHLFCDKTGTLTKNELVFRVMAVGNHTFTTELDDVRFAKFAQKIKNHTQIDDQFVNFWRCLCVCHDIIQFKLEGQTEVSFTGPSQDEITFLEMCKDVGFTSFTERTSNTIVIDVQGKQERYEILKIIDFTSDRKRMSVIVKREGDGKVINFIKGADIAIIPRIDPNQDKEKNDQTINIMNEQAAMGLRTLMFGIKFLADDSTKESLNASNEEDLENCCELLGITGLEDLLQDNVAECIKQFRAAKIKVWMLTGDKGETAENIGQSCGLIDPQKHKIFKVSGQNLDQLLNDLKNISDQASKIESKNPTSFDINKKVLMIPNQKEDYENLETLDGGDRQSDNFKEYSLLINGESLAQIFSNQILSDMIRKLFDKAQSVIVFRSSPNDKAEVVKFVKSKGGIFTLAIGDGGNDVNMIQSASIGVGLMGKEGNQAAAFSDYAIPNFQGLNRLVFWHGLQLGHRIVIFIILLNFFKGALYITGTFAANFNNGFSGLALYKELYYSLHPVTLTTFTVATFFMAEQAISYNPNKYKKDNLQKEAHTSKSYNPASAQPFSLESIWSRDTWLAQNGISVNTDGSTNNLTDFFIYVRDSWIKNLSKIYAVNLAWAFVCGVIMYTITFNSMSDIINSKGQVNDYWNTGVVLFFTLIITHHALIWTETRNHTWYTVAWYLVVLFFFYLAISGSDKLKTSSYFGNQFSVVLGSPLTWLVVFIQSFINVMPRFLFRTLDGIIFHPEFIKIKAE